MTAVACAGGVAVLPLLRASDAVLAVGVRVAALALVGLAAALVRGWTPLVPLSLLALAGIYAAQIVVDDVPLDNASAVLAAGLLVTAELSYWSLEERARVRAAAGERLRRLAFVAVLGLASLVVGLVLLTLVDAVRTRGLAIDVVGAFAAAASLLAVALFARGRGQTSH